jgi:glucosamine 6-phosphate synthetase-like amidotransferase/phosphosugar isomerase protein
MCSIYGSPNRSMFDILHESTIDRGKFAFSYTFINKQGELSSNQLQGHPDIDKIPDSHENIMHLGHNQAPTSSQRVFNKNTCHPFKSGKWLVAHNGVLTNHDELLKKYKISNTNPVDTSAIPLLLDHFSNSNKNSEISTIEKTLSLIEGTFAIWIINTDKHNVYLARQGSTLFCNPQTGSFCSIASKSWEELSEGIIYQVNNNITAVGKFKNSTPFLTL